MNDTQENKISTVQLPQKTIDQLKVIAKKEHRTMKGQAIVMIAEQFQQRALYTQHPELAD